jgi:hypothetical protein
LPEPLEPEGASQPDWSADILVRLAKWGHAQAAQNVRAPISESVLLTSQFHDAH